MIKAVPVDIRVTVLFVLHAAHRLDSWDSDQRLACPLLRYKLLGQTGGLPVITQSQAAPVGTEARSGQN
jgi:hypothetical protein